MFEGWFLPPVVVICVLAGNVVLCFCGRFGAMLLPVLLLLVVVVVWLLLLYLLLVMPLVPLLPDDLIFVAGPRFASLSW